MIRGSVKMGASGGGVKSRKAIGRRALASAVIWALAVVALASTAQASTYIPTKTTDNPSGGLTLREAIIKANSHAGDDRIVLRAGKTYKLSQVNAAGDEDLGSTGDLDINEPGGSDLKIASNGAALATINAQRIDRVFETVSSATFVRLLIRGGSASGASDDGGGISRGAGAVVLRQSRVSGNLATGDGGGIEVGSGGLFASRSLISGNRAEGSGGGVYAEDGPATISKSTIKNNVADADTDGHGDSGGLENEDSMTIRASTISGNSTSGISGGGGIRNRFGTLTIVNSTIAGNSATHPTGVGGGGLVSDGTALFMNSVTIARNSSAGDAGGFDHDAGSFSVKNSLIAQNTAPTAPNCQGGAGVVSFGENRIGDNTNCNFNTVGSDRVDLLPSEIKIGQLDDNGGPTKTIELRLGSVAVDKADSDAPNRDQRGVKRNDRGGPDIGAFELR